MFVPANEHAKRLMSDESFGSPSLFLLQYPQYIPPRQAFVAHAKFQRLDLDNSSPLIGAKGSMWFLDHLCHPMSLLLMLAGKPRTFSFERSNAGAGVLNFTFASGAVGTVALTSGASYQGGLERTMIIGDRGRHIVVENNHRVTFHKNPPVPFGETYGTQPVMFQGGPGESTTLWEPEFSLGQLYNKALFLIGYWGEINEFAEAVLENRPPVKATLDDAHVVTRVFELFKEVDPGQRIEIAYK
jgi:predicted dehydrogenase